MTYGLTLYDLWVTEEGDRGEEPPHSMGGEVSAHTLFAENRKCTAGVCVLKLFLLFLILRTILLSKH